MEALWKRARVKRSSPGAHRSALARFDVLRHVRSHRLDHLVPSGLHPAPCGRLVGGLQALGKSQNLRDASRMGT
jgi:hypothetical protein